MKKFKPYDGMIVYDRQGNECVVKFRIKTKNDPDFWPPTHWRVEGGELGEGFNLDYALEEGIISFMKNWTNLFVVKFLVKHKIETVKKNTAVKIKFKIRQLKFDIRVYLQSRGKLKVKIQEWYISNHLSPSYIDKDTPGYLDCFSGGCAIVIMNLRPKYLSCPYPGQYVHKIPCDKIIVIS